MLTLMCPNCRHRFPAPGCCDSSLMPSMPRDQFSTTCGGDFLVPRGYLHGGGCVINSPTILQGPAIIHGLGAAQDALYNNQNEFTNLILRSDQPKLEQQFQMDGKSGSRSSSPIDGRISSHSQIGDTRDLTATGKKRNIEALIPEPNPQRGIFQNPHPMLFPPPSGCQELPGTRASVDSGSAGTAFDFRFPEAEDYADWTRRKNGEVPKLTGSVGPANMTKSSAVSAAAGTVIQVNATLQLPPNVGQCTVSITATANSVPSSSSSRSRNNFHGGGIVEPEAFGNTGYGCDREDNSPTTPVSWVLPFPWGTNGNSGNNSTDLERISAAQRVLQISGWYHEGLSWQQSAALLNNSPVGSWLMRDSSDKRYMYAVSVQTARGPTAVRVHYLCGKFRLDAEPRMAPLMPMFDCPIKMIEYYIEYSKKMKEQKEVWVDHSGQLYSQIYLTKPIAKEVRSLSHFARLAINRSKISTKELPAPLRNYITEYPYTE
ncbi:uncharacterized protein Ttc26 isoform X4 [Neodiprion pinetum]|uniref:uncharacterized protein Ttc26 isoform X4 n=1 Tax=Neodiprion pinetum TaxID=441929 RepID=UPI001EDD431E|nr:uncharacterized protein LOC124211214 isoform X4 [Neodiprion pinetum]XP_046466003.1 uncharacterized protein LOC124211214 isoform X4 [Neodiprion pinetum]XP_046466004.1 uncharacterized protein LOC124211214 isoform X4 [Neodiprion pinetum]